MKIFFDTEFIEDGHTIDLISIGMVKEDENGAASFFYAENSECDLNRADPWVKENVIPHLVQNLPTRKACYKHYPPISNSRKDIPICRPRTGVLGLLC